MKATAAKDNDSVGDIRWWKIEQIMVTNKSVA